MLTRWKNAMEQWATAFHEAKSRGQHHDQDETLLSLIRLPVKILLPIELERKRRAGERVQGTEAPHLPREQQELGEDLEARKRAERVIKLVLRGERGKALRLLVSFGIAPEDEETPPLPRQRGGVRAPSFWRKGDTHP